MPAQIKINVANKERTDSLAMPQIPWPLIQPLAMHAPKPTRKLPVASNHKG